MKRPSVIRYMIAHAAKARPGLAYRMRAGDVPLLVEYVEHLERQAAKVTSVPVVTPEALELAGVEHERA